MSRRFKRDFIIYSLMLRKKNWQFTLDTENIRL